MYDLIDILCVLCGAYLIYAAVAMKKQGRIIENVLLKKGMDESEILDKEGFIQFLYGKLLLCGIVIIIAAIINLINTYQNGNSVVSVVSCCVFAVSIIAYGIVTNLAMRRYTSDKKK